jgi:transcriptional regulator with XRE-family HTH domain
MKMQGLQQHVGLRLKTLREAKGLSQEALAAVCGFHRTYVGLIERGERNISVSTIEQLAAGLGVEPAALLEASGAAPPPQKRTSGIGKAAMPPVSARDTAAHLAVIRKLLIKAKLTTAEEYSRLVAGELGGKKA